MARPQSKVTAQGKISVPAEIRRKLGIGPGSVLEWDQNGDEVVVRKVGRYSSEDIHHALFGRRPKKRSLRDLKASIAKQRERKKCGPLTPTCSFVSSHATTLPR